MSCELIYRELGRWAEHAGHAMPYWRLSNYHPYSVTINDRKPFFQRGQTMGTVEVGSELQKRIEALQAENAKLRAALVKLVGTGLAIQYVVGSQVQAQQYAEDMGSGPLSPFLEPDGRISLKSDRYTIRYGDWVIYDAEKGLQIVGDDIFKSVYMKTKPEEQKSGS